MQFLTGETAVALIGAVGGGMFVKLIDRHYQLKEKDMDAGAHLRGELHDEIVSLKTDLKNVQRELDDWRKKYYRLFERHVLLKVINNGLRQRIEGLTGERIPPEAEEDSEEADSVGTLKGL
jgi:hypothetical protein